MSDVPRAEVGRVCQVVRRWVRRVYAGSANLDDLCQEGCLGVLEALRTYDPERGAKFITYAFRGAQLRVWRFMEKDTVWHTTSTHQAVREHRRGERQLHHNSSLDARRGEDGETSLHDKVAAELEDPDCGLWDDDVLGSFQDALDDLSNRLSTDRLRAAAVEMRKDPTKSPKVIGEAVGLSHERVHHVRNRAIQMTRDRVGIDRWMPRHRMVAVVKG